MAEYIAHVDMDAFFASVEQATNPMLRNCPIIVAGKSPRHGVVTSASYEARKKGVRAGMSSYEALKLCPEAISVGVDGKKYEAVSKEVMKLISDVSPRVAVASIDEAYIDMSVYDCLDRGIGRLKRLKSEMMRKLGLPISVGIGVNPIIAKIASDFDKPNGFVIVKNGYESCFLKEVKVSDVPGIGPHLSCFAESLGYKKAIDLIEEDTFELYKNFGNSFLGLVKAITATDFSRDAFFRSSPPKSFGHSMTFTRDVQDVELLRELIAFLGAKVIYRMRKKNFEGRGISVYLKYSDRKVSRVSKRLSFYINDVFMMNEVVYWLIKNIWTGDAVRGAGVSCYHLKEYDNKTKQMGLFKESRDPFESIFKLDEKYGNHTVFPANLLQVSAL